ncbi:MAG: glycosyltransferase family 2 protein [Phototrophicaceae bacterium]
MSQPLTCSVVIPVYRSETMLKQLVERLHAVLHQHCTQFEVILVNDCSPDGSWAVIQTLSQEYSWVRGIHLMRNFGQQSALLCGIRAAQYEIIINMDDDLQHQPEDIPKFLGKLAEGYEVVHGVPQQLAHSATRNWASNFVKRIMVSVLNIPYARQIYPYRAFYAYLRKAFEHYDSPYVNIDALLSWGSNRFAQVEIVHHTRTEGQSGYTFGKLLNYAINLITGFSVVPLRLASLLGLVFMGLGFVLIVYVVGVFLFVGRVVPGFLFLSVTVLLFSGVQLFVLGIIGEYLARMFVRTMNKPNYVIKETTH